MEITTTKKPEFIDLAMAIELAAKIAWEYGSPLKVHGADGNRLILEVFGQQYEMECRQVADIAKAAAV